MAESVPHSAGFDPANGGTKPFMYYVYILQSQKDHSYYTGFTRNIEIRLSAHNSGKKKSIKHKRPYILIYKEEYKTQKEAKLREKQIKSYKSGEAFKNLIKKL